MGNGLRGPGVYQSNGVRRPIRAVSELQARALFDVGSPSIPVGARAKSLTTTTAFRSGHSDIFAAQDTRPPETAAESNLMTPASYLTGRQELTLIEYGQLV
jgi:hypothetical protein